MSAIRTQVAEAVKDELNVGSQAGAFGPYTFAAVRKNVPVADLTELKALHVTVVGRSFGQERITRSDTATEIEVDVAVQQKVPGPDPEYVDPLAELVEKLINFFEDRSLAGFPAAVWLKTRNPLLYFPEHLDQDRVFTSVITLTYRVIA